MAIAPQILAEPAAPDPTVFNFWRSQAGIGSSRPLTHEMLREAFNACSKGHNKPDYIVTSRTVYQTYARELGLVYDVDLAA